MDSIGSIHSRQSQESERDFGFATLVFQCRNPNGFGAGIIVSLSIVPMFLAVELTYQLSGIMARRMRKSVRMLPQ